jgi:glutathione peroxidase-family protein
LTTFIFTACEKSDSASDKNFEKDEWEITDKEGDDKDKKDCFNLIYPVTYTMPDGTNISGDDEEALWGAIKVWYENHPDVKEEPSLNYPIQIAFPDSDVPVTVNNEEEKNEIKKEKCDYADDKDIKDCFNLIYPVTYTMPDGTNISGDDEEVLWGAIKVWYENHPDVKEEPSLNYPVQIAFPDSDVPVTVNNEEEMMEIKKEKCDYADDKDIKDCFNLIYPVTYTMPDGTNISGDDEEALWGAIKAWYEDHPDVKEEPSLNYPVQIAFPDSDVHVTVNNEEEMSEIKEDCDD